MRWDGTGSVQEWETRVVTSVSLSCCRRSAKTTKITKTTKSCVVFVFVHSLHILGCLGSSRSSWRLCAFCRAEYEELKKAKEKAEEDTIFSFKRKKGCQAERKQVGMA